MTSPGEATPISREVAEQYDAYQQLYDRWGSADGYLNWGYATRLRQPTEDAAEALVRRVFDAVAPAPGELIVDVGFGTGGQDFFAARNYDFEGLVGFNISSRQVANANRLARERELDHRLRFYEQPAEDMAVLDAGEADKMVAIECAPHFERGRFYAEAARVLRPGGLLALADFCFAPALGFVPRRGAPELQRVGDLASNRATWEQHFDTRRIENINLNVIPGCQRTVLRVLSSILRIDDPGLRQQWAKLGVNSQVITIGLALRALRYDLIVLERR